MNMSIVKTLQANVRRLMKERGLTQVDVAKRGQISQGSVSIAVRGTHSQTVDIVAGLARGLGVTPADLLSNNPGRVSPELDELVRLYSLLPPESQEEVLRSARNEYRYQQLSSKD